jgi:amino-acid N-acetyltransferase
MRESTAEDLPAIRSLLTEAGLPTTDVNSSPGLRLWVAEDGSALVGVIGLEQYLSAGLLRSLVVSPHHRKRGLARRLVDTVKGHAKAADLKQLALLTETADRFFEALGYRLIDRQSVPEDVRQSAEFRTLCPLSARCMAKVIA